MQLKLLKRNYFFGLNHIDNLEFNESYFNVIANFCKENENLPALVFLVFNDRQICDKWAYLFLCFLQQPATIYSLPKLKKQIENEEDIRPVKVYYLQDIEYFLASEKLQKENMPELIELLIKIRDNKGVIFFNILDKNLIPKFFSLFPNNTIENDFYCYFFTKETTGAL